MRFYRCFLTVLFALVLPSYVASQGQELTLNPNPVGRGDKFTATFIVPHKDVRDVALEIPEDLDGYVLYSGPYISRYSSNDLEGDWVRIRCTFRAVKSGRHRFGGFRVVDQDEEELLWAPEDRLLEVGYYRNRSLTIPIEASWEIPQETVYVGQSVPVSLMLDNNPELSFVTRVYVPSAKSGFFEEADGLGTIEVSSVGDLSLYRIPGASYIVTPSKPGVLEIPASRVYLGSRYGIAESEDLEVLPLPPTVRSTGAIGSLTQRVWYEPSRPVQGEPLVFTVRISGSGNFNYFQIPEISASSADIADQKEFSRIRPSADGYEGYKEVQFTVIPGRDDFLDVEIPSFPYLDRETGEVKTFDKRKFHLKINPAEYKSQQTDVPLWERYTLLSVEELQEAPRTVLFSNPLNYILVLPGVLAAIVLCLVGRKKTALAVLAVFTAGTLGALVSESNWLSVRAAVEAQDWDRAVQEVRAEESLWEDNSVYAYNRALVEAYADNRGESVFYLRRAIALDPSRRLFVETLDGLEREWGLVYQIGAVPQLHPDTLFWVLIVSFSVSALVFGVSRISSRRFWLGLGVVSFLIFGVSVGGIVWLEEIRGREWAVVRTDEAVLRKIPRQEARPWIEVGSGSALKVLGESGEFSFVESGNGLRGWIGKDNLIEERS